MARGPTGSCREAFLSSSWANGSGLCGCCNRLRTGSLLCKLKVGGPMLGAAAACRCLGSGWLAASFNRLLIVDSALEVSATAFCGWRATRRRRVGSSHILHRNRPTQQPAVQCIPPQTCWRCCRAAGLALRRALVILLFASRSRASSRSSA